MNFELPPQPERQRQLFAEVRTEEDLRGVLNDMRYERQTIQGSQGAYTADQLEGYIKRVVQDARMALSGDVTMGGIEQDVVVPIPASVQYLTAREGLREAVIRVLPELVTMPAWYK